MDLLQIVKGFNEILWNSFLMYVLLGVGIFYTLYLGFPQIRHFGLAMKYSFGSIFKKREKDTADSDQVNSFQALATAVAAQVGTGNIAGVATAIAMGGTGAVFWMWISALLGMGTIFSEAVLAQEYREVRDGQVVGGPAYYIHRGLKSKKLAAFFSIAVIIALGFIGCMVQANSISIGLTSAFGMKDWTSGLLIAALVAIVIVGGQKRVTTIAELVVPFMAVAYILGAIIILFIYSDQIQHVFLSIFEEAFSTEAAAGGAAGTVMKYAIRYGISRGLFSNEAGMGSTPHAHALANVKDPSIQGFVAMSGVFVDLLICSATAFIILLTGVHDDTGLISVQITQKAFEQTFGHGGVVFLAVSLLIFAFTTIIGWYVFGEMNIRYLFPKKAVYVFRGIVICCIFSATIFRADLIWELADTFNGIMVIPNVIAIIILAPQVKKIYKRFLQRRKTESL
ncbi:amino acid carrier protein [Porphyromonas sp. oral taxon 278 str. W7784]|uniref:alanine/glycine:cation symporter family protein n=1 Tax=Porphyromonas sp. oral taxon 278 TaxID=712437 RepID=UPI0003AD5491|nr:sodium:alanine symporter family protein [Porphyromonas sp. oral taxon 278]ERJ70297.1 amino acid carrier protein [Porphyromonas sp. oral taxon 278 str. W7784]